ncbi:MAG: helix-turn-helix domain-containing protein [Kutzneria sp.]|nr:helix-turn-helix domain-containing protein [Kutzneria sp.]MBV9845633.1 helix-turn-helix domain-containing protein [Kutzneria sp.]
MDRRAELGEFLRSRRARLRPDRLGLPNYGRRRVPGLRREELALLAGVSVDHYVRLEQGRSLRFSDDILDSVAGVLELDDDERAHLYRLARPSVSTNGGTTPDRRQVRPGLRRLLDSMSGVPGYVIDHGVNVLYWNALAAALITDFGALPPARRNMAWLVFCDSEVRTRYRDWESKASDVVSYLRLSVGRHPDDRHLAALVADLSEASADFRRHWANHRVKDKTYGRYRLRHPLVGDLTLDYETLRLPDNADHALCAYTVEPGSSSEDALRLLEGR